MVESAKGREGGIGQMVLGGELRQALVHFIAPGKGDLKDARAGIELSSLHAKRLAGFCRLARGIFRRSILGLAGAESDKGDETCESKRSHHDVLPPARFPGRCWNATSIWSARKTKPPAAYRGVA